MAVDLAMMSSAERDDKLVADLAPQSPALRKAQMMRIGWAPTANQARLLGHIADVVAVPNATRLRQRQGGLINSLGSRPLPWPSRTPVATPPAFRLPRIVS